MKQKIILIISCLLIAIALFSTGYLYSENMQLQQEINQNKNKLQTSSEMAEDLKSELEKQKQENNNLQIEVTKNNNKPFLINNRCTYSECLFDYQPVDKEGDITNIVGTGLIKGYYTQTEREIFGETYQCDTLVVTDGSEGLRNHLLSLVNNGNTVNITNAQGQLTVNLNLDNATSIEKETIVRSTEKEPIELLVMRPGPPPGRGAAPCESLINILELKQ